jgi:hypothetical protein
MATRPKQLKVLERAMGFEPTTTCLGSKDSTTELRPLAVTYQALTVSGLSAIPSGVITVLILKE